MTIQESLLVAVFCMVMVFALLACVFILVKILSVGVALFFGSNRKTVAAAVATEIAINGADQGIFSAGTIKLKQVDEPTAAMLMAIVSDESGIPLEELCFKSIKLIKE